MYICICLYVCVFVCVEEDVHVHVCNAAWRYVCVRVLQIELYAFFSYVYMCPDMHLHVNIYIHIYVHFYIFWNIHAEYHRKALEDNPFLIRTHIYLQRALQPTEIYDCNPQDTLYIGTTPRHLQRVTLSLVLDESITTAHTATGLQISLQHILQHTLYIGTTPLRCNV